MYTIYTSVYICIYTQFWKNFPTNFFSWCIVPPRNAGKFVSMSDMKNQKSKKVVKTPHILDSITGQISLKNSIWEVITFFFLISNTSINFTGKYYKKKILRHIWATIYLVLFTTKFYGKVFCHFFIKNANSNDIVNFMGNIWHTGQNIPSRNKKKLFFLVNSQIGISILGPRMLPEHIIEGVICIIECVGIVMAIGGSVLQSESKKKTTNSYFFQHAPFPNDIYFL